MNLPMLAPGHVDEPNEALGYSAVLTKVALECQPVVVRREGTDFAAVIPLAYLELLQDVLATQEAQRMIKAMPKDYLRKLPPPPVWFEGDEPKPF